jgi:agmatine/peptidylarginine deiminase
LILLLATTGTATGQVVGNPWYRNRQFPYRPQQPGYYPPVQSQPPIQKLPPGATTRVLPDGRIAIITPFTAKQKREVRERQAEHKRVRAIRTRELAALAENDSLFPRLIGEFEKQKAIVISICDWQAHHFDVLFELIEKTRRRLGILLLYNDKKQTENQSQFEQVIRRLSQTGRDYPHLRFYKTNLDTIWLRDFGPRLAQTDEGKAVVVDFFYDVNRARDDDFPKVWANLTGGSHNVVPWSLQGGNLLANGLGLAITTTRLYEGNRIKRPGKTFTQTEVYVKEQLMKFCNIKELVVLKPLENESTRHVDMFATFLAPDVAVVAKVDPRFDAQNAAILDENARQLSQVSVSGRPLRVERIWIPPRRHNHWSSYANIILTDQVVLIPTYKSDPPDYIQQATATYRRLLPQHHVTTIDMTSMEKLGGSLHCLSCSIPASAALPKDVLTFADAVEMTK